MGDLNRREFLIGSIGAGIGALGSGCATAPPAEPIRAALRPTVGARETVGTVAVVVDDGGTRLVAQGSAGAPGVALDVHAVFEIGSITKVITALMLADMAARGEVAFDDRLADYLPPSVTLHERARSITLRDLAGYNAGLPKLPGNVPANWYVNPNPFAAYTVDNLYDATSRYVPAATSDGRPYIYSSFAFGLLGVAVARRAGKSFEALMIERVCGPLGLSNTRITLSADMRKHLVQPHDVNLKPTPLWDLLPSLQGAGGARASVSDAAAFLKACMGVTRTALREPLTRLLETRRPTPLAGTQAALGWFISSSGAEEIVWKSGLTGGCNAFVGFSTRRRCGAAVLSNFVWEPLDVGTTAMALKMINPDFDAGDLSLLYQ